MTERANLIYPIHSNCVVTMATKPNQSRNPSLPDLKKPSPDSQAIITYLKDFVTTTICQKIDEKNAEIQKLSDELKTVKEDVRKLEDTVMIQKYELDEIKYQENKNFMVLSGPGILQSDEAPANIITATLRNKIGLAVDSVAISEATTITLKKKETRRTR